MHLLSSSDALHYPILILCITPRSSGTHGGTSPLCLQAVLLTGIWLQVVGREYVDAKVVEAHIVPGRLLLTSLVPTPELATVAWEQAGVQVNVSLQVSRAQQGQVLVR